MPKKVIKGSTPTKYDNGPNIVTYVGEEKEKSRFLLIQN